MKLFTPKNVFTSLFQSVLPDTIEVINRPSSLVVKELDKTTNGIALIPSLDLVKNRNLFVSGKLGLAFDGLLSQSYFRFVEGVNEFKEVFIRGDVSMNELLLTKILFQERYSSTVDLVLDTSQQIDAKRNYIICGDDNFPMNSFEKGISFADEIAEMLDLPYVNYVFVSPDREALQNFEHLVQSVDSKISDSVESSVAGMDLTPAAKEFLITNVDTLYFDLMENEQDALNELVKLIYYHKIIDDIFDIKFL